MADRISASWPAKSSSFAACPVASPGRPSIAVAAAAGCSRCKHASSTSAAKNAPKPRSMDSPRSFPRVANRTLLVLTLAWRAYSSSRDKTPMRNLKTNSLLFELSKPGRRGARLPVCDVPAPSAADLLPADAVAAQPPPLPEVAEPEVVRHFTNLSTLNMSVDTHFYPLGSCTMKYNSKRNERMAALPGIADLHPLQAEDTIQGLLQLLFELQQMLAEISGLPAVSMQPAAGAHGELAALMVAAAYFRHQKMSRTKVLAPDSAHGTNPASARMAGFEFVTVKSRGDGMVDLNDLATDIDDQIAVFMITNPSTLGLFDQQVPRIARMIHERGGLIYLDGANMNAILGITRPGDFGVDMMHYNPHKTFSGPHGGGGPGAGPIAVTDVLGAFLPLPLVAREGNAYRLDYDRPQSIGRVRA